MNVYLVVGHTEYESSRVIAAFSTEDKAKTFAQKCRDYDASAKPCPELNAPEAEWEKWQRSNARWYKRHPVSELGGYESYFVDTLKVQ